MNLDNDHIDELIARREAELLCYQHIIIKILEEIKKLKKSRKGKERE